MGKAVKKTISLPPDLASEAEEIARPEGMTLSTVIQDALRLARAKRLRDELEELQGFWSRRAQERGILTSLRDYLDRLVEPKACFPSGELGHPRVISRENHSGPRRAMGVSMSGSKKQSSEAAVREIRRRTRRPGVAETPLRT